MMPNRSSVIERARALFAEDAFRHGSGNVNTPEDSELLESGFYSQALSELMRNPETGNENWLDQKVKTETDLKSENLAKCEELIFDTREALDTGFFVSGTSQCGKTNLVKLLVRKLTENGIRVYVFDASGVWSHDSPIKHVVEILGTEKQVTVPADNAVLDIARLTTRKKIRFVNTTCGFFYSMHVKGEITCKDFIVLEECQTYLFNGCMKLSMRRESPCENVISLVTVGANFGLRFGIVTQFAAMVDKLPVKISGQRYFGRTSEPNDLKYLQGFVGKDWAARLRNLEKGEFVYQMRNKIELLKTEVYGKSKNWCSVELPNYVVSNNRKV